MIKLSEIKEHDMCEHCYWSKTQFPVGSLVKTRLLMANCVLLKEKINQNNYLSCQQDQQSPASAVIRSNSLLLVLNHFHNHRDVEYKYIGAFHFLFNSKAYLYFHSYRHFTEKQYLNLKFNNKFIFTLSKVLERV